MAISSLPSSHISRWGLDGLIAVLSIIAIAISASHFNGDEQMYTGFPGDVRGLMVIMGSAGLIGTTVLFVLRLITLILPRIWTCYLDRLGFTFVSLMWICWASATMSFALFTIDTSLCQTENTPLKSIDILPSCSKLSFDLTLLHLISIISFCQVLNYLSISLSSLQNDRNGDQKGKDGNGNFVMWELAIGSIPPSPVLAPRRTLKSSQPRHIGSNRTQVDEARLSSSMMGGYGSTANTSIPTLMIPEPEEDEEEISISQISINSLDSTKTQDKFSQGRLWTYIPLNLCSLFVACTSFASIRVGEFTSSGVFVMVVALGGIFLSLECLITHFAQKRAERDQEDLIIKDYSKSRRHRMLEVGIAGLLFIIWPVSAILYTLYPPIPYQPCSNPSASAAPSPGEDYNIEPFPLCQLGKTVVILSWIGSWLLLTRIMGLIFPITQMENVKLVSLRLDHHNNQNEENRALLDPSSSSFSKTHNTNQNKHNFKSTDNKSTKKGWERVRAGEEFELGSDDE